MQIVYRNGEAVFTAPQGQKIAMTCENSTGVVYYSTFPNSPELFYEATRVTDSAIELGPFPADRRVRIEAFGGNVKFKVAVSPLIVTRYDDKIGIRTISPDTGFGLDVRNRTRIESPDATSRGQFEIIDPDNASTVNAAIALLSAWGNNEIGTGTTGRLWAVGSESASNMDMFVFNALAGSLNFYTNAVKRVEINSSGGLIALSGLGINRAPTAGFSLDNDGETLLDGTHTELRGQTVPSTYALDHELRFGRIGAGGYDQVTDFIPRIISISKGELDIQAFDGLNIGTINSTTGARGQNATTEFNTQRFNLIGNPRGMTVALDHVLNVTNAGTSVEVGGINVVLNRANASLVATNKFISFNGSGDTLYAEFTADSSGALRLTGDLFIVSALGIGAAPDTNFDLDVRGRTRIEAPDATSRGQFEIIDPDNASTANAAAAILSGWGNDETGTGSTGRMWVVGSESASNKNMVVFNALAGSLNFSTSAIKRVEIDASGDLIALNSIKTTQRWIYEKEFILVNVPANQVSNLTYSTVAGFPISFITNIKGNLSVLRISLDKTSEYDNWTNGTMTFGIVHNGGVVFTSSAFTKAAFDAAAGSFVFVKSITLAVDIDFAAGDELSCEISTSAPFNGTSIDMHMIQHGFYDNT